MVVNASPTQPTKFSLAEAGSGKKTNRLMLTLKRRLHAPLRNFIFLCGLLCKKHNFMGFESLFIAEFCFSAKASRWVMGGYFVARHSTGME